MERGRLAEERRQEAAAQAVHLSAGEHLRGEPLQGRHLRRRQCRRRYRTSHDGAQYPQAQTHDM